MSTRARLLGGALSLLVLLVMTAAGLASAASPPPPTKQVGPANPGKVTRVGQTAPAPATPAGIHAIGYRLSAALVPASSTSAASGRWDGVLVHTVGVVQNGVMPSIAGCSVTSPKAGGPGQAPPRRSGLPHTIKCGGAAGGVPSFPVPGSGNHWILGWKLTYSNMSSAVSGADILVKAAAGAAAVAPTSLCTTCTSGKFGRTILTADQANAIVNGQGSVVVRTTNNPGGEISGPITQVKPAATKASAGSKTNKK